MFRAWINYLARSPGGAPLIRTTRPTTWCWGSLSEQRLPDRPEVLRHGYMRRRLENVTVDTAREWRAGVVKRENWTVTMELAGRVRR